jgi:hypothetical protein
MKIRIREKRGIISPQNGSRVERRSKGNKNRAMVAAGKGDNGGRWGKGSVAYIHEDMVKARQHNGLVASSFGKRKIRSVCTRKSSIRKRSQDRKQTGPSMIELRSGDRTAIAGGVRIVVPVANEKVKGGKKKGGSRKALKETTTGRAVGMSIDVGNFINLPLEAEGGS